MKVRTWLMKAFVSTAFAVSPANAQFGIGSVVYDPAAVAQLTTQVSYQLQMINQLVQQVQQGQSMLQSLGSSILPGLSNLTQQSQSLVSSLNGIANTGASLTSLLDSQYPTDFSNLNSVSAILSKIAAMQTQARQAMQASMTMQGQVASNQPQIAAAMQSAGAASNAAAGPTAALQATNQMLAALSTQIADLQTILIAHLRAEEEQRLSDQASITAGNSAYAAELSAPVDTTVTPATNN
jgi:P-type conjugative transfer protein TrbJ